MQTYKNQSYFTGNGERALSNLSKYNGERDKVNREPNHSIK